MNISQTIIGKARKDLRDKKGSYPLQDAVLHPVKIE